MKVKPPKKRAGQATGRRSLNGELLDVHHGATFLGSSEKTLRARVDRRTIPFRRFGARVVFLRQDLEAFIANLPGCTLAEARRNLAVRKSDAGI